MSRSYYGSSIVFNSQTRDFVREFYTNFGEFWPSADGNYLFCSSRDIYRVSSLLSSSDYYISPIGSFTPYPNQIYWIDHSAASHSVWILSSSPDYYDNSRREILQYEDNDYTRVKTYFYDDYYNGNPVQAHYVFANGTGSELVVIKNIVSDNNLNDWSIEHVAVIK